jgi:hypothetical protein
MNHSDKDKKNSIKLFEEHKVRTSWNSEEEKWYFSIEDVVFILTGSVDVKQYIKKMRKRDPELNFNWGTICTHVQMVAKDGKNRKVLAANVEGILRLIQSIPSPKAEPFKLWLAKVGSERIDEIQNPEIAINRALQNYRNLGYSEAWINQRLKSIEVRKNLTDEWKRSGVKDTQYGFLTDILTKEWSGMKTKEYKEYKGLKKENLRDNMSNLELVLNMLAEVSTTEISKGKNPKTLDENIQVAKEGGSVAKNARLDIETKTGNKIITKQNAKDIRQIETNE